MTFSVPTKLSFVKVKGKSDFGFGEVFELNPDITLLGGYEAVLKLLGFEVEEENKLELEEMIEPEDGEYYEFTYSAKGQFHGKNAMIFIGQDLECAHSRILVAM